MVICSSLSPSSYAMDAIGDVELGNRGLGGPKHTLSFEQRPGRADVIKEAQAYIEECRNQGQTDWGDLLEHKLQTFEKIKTSALLELAIHVVEYHSGVDSETHSTSKEIRNFRDLLGYLNQKPLESLRAQVLTIIQSKSIAEESITFLESAQAVRELDVHLFSHAISAMLFVVLATRWEGQDQDRLKHLFEVDLYSHMAPKSIPLQLPSRVKQQHPSRSECLKRIPFLVKPHLFQNDNAVNTLRLHRRPPKTDWVNILYLPPADGVTHLRLINSIKCSYKVTDGPIDIASEYGISEHLPEHATALTPSYAIGSVARKAFFTHLGILNDLKGPEGKLVCSHSLLGRHPLIRSRRTMAALTPLLQRLTGYDTLWIASNS